MNKQKIESFFISYQSTLQARIEGYIYNENKELLSLRTNFEKLKKLVEKFLTNQILETEKIILLPGIRGTGKSTLLAQIYSIEKYLDYKKDPLLFENLKSLDEKLYLDVSQLHAKSISLQDFFEYYEVIKDFHFETLNKKFLLLIDEIHFDEKWQLFLKNLFDRTKAHKNLLIIATGSSAINLKLTADLARRTENWNHYPMTFDEFLLLKYKNKIPENLSSQLIEILFQSSNANEVFEKLQNLEKDISRLYVQNVPYGAEKDFFEIGGFPNTYNLLNKQKVVERINSILDSMIVKDILKLKKFETTTISKINDLLSLLAQSDVITFKKLQETLHISKIETLESLIETLIISGILIRVKIFSKTSYGSTRKTPKYLFISPTIRAAILNQYFLSLTEGKKLEDYFTLLFESKIKNQILSLRNELFYDLAQGGADFIVSHKNNKNIVIELGFQKEETSQVSLTMKKLKANFGLVFGSQNLEIVHEKIVKIPLKFFLFI